MQWEYDRELGWHTKAIDESKDEFVFVYKTAAGDYAISAMREGDVSGGQVDFELTLAKAKKAADNLIASGRYTQYFENAQ